MDTRTMAAARNLKEHNSRVVLVNLQTSLQDTQNSGGSAVTLDEIKTNLLPPPMRIKGVGY
jgi:hypothetical protein